MHILLRSLGSTVDKLSSRSRFAKQYFLTTLARRHLRTRHDCRTEDRLPPVELRIDAAVIVKAGPQLRGDRTHGLLAYLLGPGRHTDHVDPRVITGWVPPQWLPVSDVDATGRVTYRDTTRPDGMVRSHPQVAGLAAALELPVRTVSPAMRPLKHVWHCIVQNDPAVDPVLSDEVWAGIAHELVDAVGLTNCRWVAVRHDDHGIHIAATLVTETGQRPRLSFELRRLNACRTRLEAQHCRRRTDPGTRTGGVSYQRHEVEKARREGATRPAKVRLRNAIEEAVLATNNPADFQEKLAADGVRVGYRYSTTAPDQITGYKAALDRHTTAAGDLIWYKASDIDRALTWPKIQTRWGCPRIDNPDHAEAAVVNDYTARLRVATGRLTQRPDHATAMQAGITDLATALAHTRPDTADGVDWDQVLDNTYWTGRSPGGTGVRRHHRPHCRRARPPTQPRHRQVVAVGVGSHRHPDRRNTPRPCLRTRPRSTTTTSRTSPRRSPPAHHHRGRRRQQPAKHPTTTASARTRPAARSRWTPLRDG